MGHKHLAWPCNKTFSLPKKKKKERISKEKLSVKLGRLVLLLYLYRITYSHRIGHVVRAKMLSSAYDRSLTSLQRIGMPAGTEFQRQAKRLAAFSEVSLELSKPSIL